MEKKKYKHSNGMTAIQCSVDSYSVYNINGVLITDKIPKELVEFTKDWTFEDTIIQFTKKIDSSYSFIKNVCLSYRHDFGLMTIDDQHNLLRDCKEWIRAINNNIT